MHEQEIDRGLAVALGQLRGVEVRAGLGVGPGKAPV